MSAPRRPNDHYPTPRWCVDALLPRLYDVKMTRVLDPACGEGALLNAVSAARPASCTFGMEISPYLADAARLSGHLVTVDDALEELWTPADFIIMNPPFSLAMAFVERALCTSATVAALLRLSMMAGQARADFWRHNPADVYVLPRRPSFTANGRSDSCDYAWFVWHQGVAGHWYVLDVPPAPRRRR